jgi:polar amino acid transport system substrate-binding protein
MRFWHFVLVVLIALGAGFGGAKLATKATVSTAQTESVYERVMRTGVLRCGYAQWPPTALIKDAKTGHMFGFGPDIINEMAENLGWKVEWAEETGWDNFIQGLKNDRFDMFCGIIWENATRGREMSFSQPIAYSALHLYTRLDDKRFDEDVSILNAPEFKLATMDGEMSSVIAKKFFPDAQTVSLPAMSDGAQLFLQVADGKADGVFLEPGLAQEFANKNPDKIRQATKEPFSIFPITFGLKKEADVRMMDTVNSALGEMINQGRVNELITKYEPDTSIYMPLAKPYQYSQPEPLK